MEFFDTPLGAAVLLAVSLALLHWMYRYFQRLDREQKAAEAERQYQAWLAETYKDVDIPAFLRQPHPKHRIDEWV
jgi:hypothetical protein